MNPTIKTILAAAAIAAMGCGMASEPASKAPPELPPAAYAFLGETAKVKTVWWVNEHLVGIVLETSPGAGMTVFMDASGEYLLSGAAVDLSSGENIAELRTRTHFPAPGPTDMYRDAAETHWVATGTPGQGEPIYVVVDTQCPYCHEAAKAIAAHGITREIRWIPVGFLGPKSTAQAAGILSLNERAAPRALWAILTGQADGAPEDVDIDHARKVAENGAWAEKWRVSGTPVMLVPHEGEIHKVVGLPQSRLWSIIAHK